MTSEEDVDPIEEAIRMSEEMSKEIKALKRDLKELRDSDDGPDSPGGSGPGVAVAEN